MSKNPFMDEESLTRTVACVFLFWSFVTLIAALLRRILFHLSETNLCANGDPRGSSVILSNTLSERSTSYLSNRWFTLHLSRDMHLALLDAIATMELCACSLDCWSIRSVAGHWGLMIAIAMNTIRGVIFTCSDAYGNPCNPWYRFLQGQTNLIWVGITWLLQLFASYTALSFSQIWWSYRPTSHHAARHALAVLTATQTSTPPPSDLHVSVWQGFLIETFGTFMDFYMAFLFARVMLQWNRRRKEEDPSVALGQTRLQVMTSLLIRMTIGLTLTSKFIYLTGLYINPANAFIQSWAMGHKPTPPHLIVYWLGPFCGVCLAVKLEQWSKHLIDSTVHLHQSAEPRPIVVGATSDCNSSIVSNGKPLTTSSIRQNVKRRSSSPHVASRQSVLSRSS